MKVRFLPILLALILSGCDQQKYRFEYSTPENAGYSSSGLDSLASFLSKAGSSSMILMVDGKVIFEWGDVTQRHVIHSMRKCLLNSLYGKKVAEGVIDTTMTLRELGIDDIEPSLTAAEKEARIADLLKSRSGIYHNAAAVSKGMLRGKPDRGTHRPGEHFYYNNWDFNALGVILEQETGESIYTLFKKEIAEPLGMRDYRGTFASIDGESDDATIPRTDGMYQYERSKSDIPAYHFRMSARDLAIYGQLYLNMGQWNGEQIVPREWIETSTLPYSVDNPEYGIAYGMLWRVLMKTGSRSSKSFYHTGAGMHMLGIYPKERLVMVHRVDTENDFNFQSNDLYRIIGLVFDAKEE